MDSGGRTSGHLRIPQVRIRRRCRKEIGSRTQPIGAAGGTSEQFRAVQDDGERAVVDELDLHLGAETTGLDRGAQTPEG